MDKIIIQGLKAHCIIGDYDWERQKPQELIFDLEMEADLTIAGRSDKLSPKTLDYAKVATAVLNFVEKSSFQLVEALAEGVAELCLSRFPIQKLHLRINKPAAIPQAEATIIEISRVPV